MDLFGALHTATLNVGVVKVGLVWHTEIMINNRYYFALQQYSGLVSAVNNLAVYAQLHQVIKPYDLIIWGNRSGTSLPFACIPW